MGKKVSREAGIAALVAEPNVKKAAKECGISERTLHRWLKEPEFAVQLAEAQRGVTKSVMRRVISRAETAIDTLDSIMTNAKASTHARVAAARTVLEFAIKAVEIEDILSRIETLEGSLRND